MTMEKGFKHFQKIPTEEEVAKIVNTISNSPEYQNNIAGDYLRIRDIMIITLYSTGGFRPCELLKLKWSDVNLETGEIKIDCWNNHERNGESAYLSPRIRGELVEFKEITSQYIVSVYLFPSLLTMEPITTDGFARRYLKLKKEAGVHQVIGYTKNGQPISNHSLKGLRKMFGDRVRKKTDIFGAMLALRHQNISTTVKSYCSRDPLEKRDIIDKTFG